MKPFKYIIFAILFSQTLIGQYRLEGSFKDEADFPLAFLDVLLTDEDSLVLHSTKTDEKGSFSLESKQGSFIFIVENYGERIYSDHFHLTSDLDLGVIQIKNEGIILKAVTLEGKKKLIERKTDRLVFNLEESIAASGGNALNALEITPGINIINPIYPLMKLSNCYL